MQIRFVFVVLLLLSTASTALGKKRKRRKKSKQIKQEKKVTITRGELCLGCMTLVEDFTKEVAKQMELVHNTVKTPEEASELTLDAGAIGANICEGERFSHYTENVRYACTKLVKDNWKQIIKPMAGTISKQYVNQKGQILENKKRMCMHSEVKACTPADFLQVAKVIKRDPCEACKAVVADIEFVLLREQRTTNEARLSLIMDTLCRDIGMRHETTSYLEEVCEDILDDVQSSVVGQIRLHSKLKNAGFKPSSLDSKVCGEFTSYCPKEDTDISEL
jgi:hypothetical protein